MPLDSNPPAEITNAPKSHLVIFVFIFVLMVKLVQANTEYYAPALIPTDATSCCMTLLILPLPTFCNLSLSSALYHYLSNVHLSFFRAKRVEKKENQWNNKKVET
jgi:hypothetical protein